MQTGGGVAHEARQRGLVLDVHVLDIELDSIEMIVATERDEILQRALSRIRHGENAVNRRLIETWIHEERYELHALRARRGDDAWVDLAPNHAELVERENLRRDNGDLVGVRQETLGALLVPYRVPERFGPLRQTRSGDEQQAECGITLAERERPSPRHRSSGQRLESRLSIPTSIASSA